MTINYDLYTISNTPFCAPPRRPYTMTVAHVETTARPWQVQTIALRLRHVLEHPSVMAKTFTFTAHKCHCASVHKNRKLWPLHLLQKRWLRQLPPTLTQPIAHIRLSNFFHVIVHGASPKRSCDCNRIPALAARPYWTTGSSKVLARALRFWRDAATLSRPRVPLRPLPYAAHSNTQWYHLFPSIRLHVCITSMAFCRIALADQVTWRTTCATYPAVFPKFFFVGTSGDPPDDIFNILAALRSPSSVPPLRRGVSPAVPRAYMEPHHIALWRSQILTALRVRLTSSRTPT